MYAPAVAVTIYRDKKNEWRWRVTSRNGRIIADSAEGYLRRGGAKRGLAALKKELTKEGAQ